MATGGWYPTGGPLSTTRRHEIAVALNEDREALRVNQYQLVVRMSGGLPPISHLAYDTLLERPVQLEEYPYDSLSQPGQRDFVQQLDHCRRNLGSLGQDRSEVGECFWCGQLAVQEQVGDLSVGGLAGEVFDGVTAIMQAVIERADCGFADDESV